MSLDFNEFLYGHNHCLLHKLGHGHNDLPVFYRSKAVMSYVSTGMGYRFSTSLFVSLMAMHSR